MIRQATKAEILEQVHDIDLAPPQREFFEHCVGATSGLWAGYAHEEMVGFWGLIPESLLSGQPYLWLYVTPALAGNEFIFVRRSQMMIAEMHKLYPVLRGHVSRDNPRAKRWLKWLGAQFEPTEGPLLRFTIKAKHYG